MTLCGSQMLKKLLQLNEVAYVYVRVTIKRLTRRVKYKQQKHSNDA